MIKQPLIVNRYDNIEEVYKASLSFLEKHPELMDSINNNILVLHELLDLIPQNIENVCSGHYFPYAGAYDEISNSYQLCLYGFYRYSFIALRSVLELGILGVYFAVDDKEHINVVPWMTSEMGTPRLKIILNKLNDIEYYKLFNNNYNLTGRIINVYGKLSNYVHIGGYKYSSMAQARSNINVFSEKALNKYYLLAKEVASLIVLTVLTKYPIGLQSLPLTEKFGLNGPAGGLLEGHQVTTIKGVLAEKEILFLKKLSDEDPSVQTTISYIESLPDMTDEEWDKQVKAFDKHMEEMKKGND